MTNQTLQQQVDDTRAKGHLARDLFEEMTLEQISITPGEGTNKQVIVLTGYVTQAQYEEIRSWQAPRPRDPGQLEDKTNE